MEVRLCVLREERLPSHVMEFGQRLKRLSEELGRYHGWGWKEWYREPKPKVE